MRLAHFATLGAYSHHEKDTQSLAQERRVARQVEFLAKVAKSGPQAEIVWNMEDVRRAVDELAASHLPRKSAEWVEKIMRQTNDAETRASCRRALEGTEVIAAGGGMQ